MFVAFTFNHAVERKDGLIPQKYRELISLAVALTTQCAYCLDVHTRAAANAGATREELAEAALMALRLFDRNGREGTT